MIAQISDFLIALFGMFRFALGLLILRFWVLGCKLAGLPLSFEAGWRLVGRLEILFRGRFFAANRFRQNWRNFAHLKLLHLLQNRTSGHFSDFILSDQAGLTSCFGSQSAPVIVLAPHSRSSSAISILIRQYTDQITLVAKSSNIATPSKIYGFHEALDFVLTDAHTLLKVRKELKSGKTIIAHPDYTLRRPGRLYHDVRVSDGLFQLAVHSKVQLIFAHCDVTKDGAIVVIFEKPDLPLPYFSASEAAQSFSRFCQKHNAHLAGQLVDGYDRKTSYAERPMFDFCVHQNRDSG